MEKYCQNCGKKLNENADVCLNCGSLISKYKKNNRMSITSLFLGAISIFMLLGSLEDESLTFYSNNEMFNFLLMFAVLVLTPAIMGLSFALFQERKKHNEMRIIGIVLNSISLIIILVTAIYIILTNL